ncbi:hypothetical protein C9J01_17225 [Photobacterium rosenbergii]|uniref:Glycosyltransferase 2-like domain-containing protein n=1 Tax=Photobacterium rosenbergii TaxID=294936 RepID=A0A2T3NBH9_9GAMM|nr:glycosyltransferase family 2 protein [Photobacterium rosenbergii]PSW11197.1 hypothetical protein C9J01_17225 [Photobacterium rosenbergii]
MISYIIVSYNSSKTIFSTIESIIESTTKPFEIIVVDNCSPDTEYVSDLENLSNIKLVKSKENLGFSKANNLGVLNSSGDTLFFINPDVFVNSKAVDSILKTVKDGVVVSSVLFDEQGNQNKSIYLIPFLSNYISYALKNKGKHWVHGALLVFTRGDFIKVGQWNEDYFMYSEDVDLCNRIHMNGLELNILNEEVIHVGGTSTSSVWSDLQRSKIVEKSSYIFYSKYNRKFDYYLINVAVILKMLITGNSSFKNKLLSFIKVAKDV